MQNLNTFALSYLSSAIVADDRIPFEKGVTFSIKVNAQGNLYCHVVEHPISWNLPKWYNNIEIWKKVAEDVSNDPKSPFTASYDYDGDTCTGVNFTKK